MRPKIGIEMVSSRRSGGRRSKALPVLLVLLLAVVLALAASAYFITRSMATHRARDSSGATPESLGLQAQDVELRSEDGIRLSAWWIPAKQSSNSRGTVILLHGMDGMDASSMLHYCEFLQRAGFATMALDMRAHGRSDGDRIGFAFEEPKDVIPAIEWIRSQPGIGDRPLALLGISMGGATAIRTAAVRPDVSAVVSISSFASIDLMLKDAMVMMGMPRPLAAIYAPFSRLAMRLLYGVWPSDASPLSDIKKIAPRPVLLIHGTGDTQVDIGHAKRLAKAGGSTTQLWIVDGASHGIVDWSKPITDEAYRERIVGFLSEAMSSEATPSQATSGDLQRGL